MIRLAASSGEAWFPNLLVCVFDVIKLQGANSETSLALHISCQLVCTFHFHLFKTTNSDYSLAHWDGLQPYSDDDTSRGSLVSIYYVSYILYTKSYVQLLAVLTGGEGNHNFVSQLKFK